MKSQNPPQKIPSLLVEKAVLSELSAAQRQSYEEDYPEALRAAEEAKVRGDLPALGPLPVASALGEGATFAATRRYRGLGRVFPGRHIYDD